MVSPKVDKFSMNLLVEEGRCCVVNLGTMNLVTHCTLGEIFQPYVASLMIVLSFGWLSSIFLIFGFQLFHENVKDEQFFVCVCVFACLEKHK